MALPMDTIVTLDRRTAGAANAAPVRVRIDDDRAMLKAAADLTRDLNLPNPRIYWLDMADEKGVLLGRERLGR